MLDWFRNRQGAKPNDALRITFAGDWAPIQKYASVIERTPLGVYGDLLPLLTESDINVVNVECVLGEAGCPVEKPGPSLRASEQLALPALSPFHVATLANNHSMDFGPDSLAETLAILRRGGFLTVGAGMDAKSAAEPLVFSQQGTTIGLINCAEGDACVSLEGGPGANPFDTLRLIKEIQTLKSKVNLVIVVFHGGREHAAAPAPYVVTALRAFVDAGADAVIAHHPHVPQGVEIYRDAPIAYSLGNFVFRWGNDFYYLNTGYLAHLDIVDKKIAEVSITPYRSEESGLRLLKGEEREEFLSELESASKLLDSSENIQALWDAFVDEIGGSEETLIEMLKDALNTHQKSPVLGVNYLRHYFGIPAHQEFLSTGFRRAKLGSLGTSPEWARYWVRRWWSRKLESKTPTLI